MDDKTLNMTMLYDFFGDLLTTKQRECFDLYHNEDLSLSEIAEKNGISRQGVFDIIARAEKTLIGFEQKTNVVAKWLKSREELEEAVKLAWEIERLSDGECAFLARELVSVLKGLSV